MRNTLLNRCYRPDLLTMMMVIVGVLSCTFCGCRRQTHKSKSTLRSTHTPTDSAQRTDDLLNSVWDMLQPDRLGISAEKMTAMNLLDQWSSSSSAPISTELNDTAVSLMEKHLSARQVKRIRAERFDDRDAEHLRNSIWYRNTVDTIDKDATNDLTQVVNLFYHVIRTIDLAADHHVLPQPLFDVGLLGKGTPASRAWLFASLLRQMRLDAVILQAPSSSNPQSSSSPPWCVGVMLNTNVYLFDTRLGLPIPSDSPDDSTLIRIPTTLKQVLADDEVLRRLDIDAEHPYPLDAEDLRSCEVKLIGTVSLWAPRMMKLQLSLSGDRSTVIYDGLADSELGPGLFTRVTDFADGNWNRKRISVWKYPERQLTDFEQLDPTQQDTLRAQRHAFEAPRTITMVIQQAAVQTKQGERIVGTVGNVTKSSIKLQVGGKEVEVSVGDIAAVEEMTEPKIGFGPPERKQLQARTTHLQGLPADAIKNYLTMRFWAQFPPTLEGVVIPMEQRAAYSTLIPVEIRRMHRKAAEDAMFWMAVCQYEQGKDKYSAAIETLNGYLNRYPNGSWFAAAHHLRAVIFATTDKLDKAIEGLNSFNDKYRNHPRHDEYELLIRKWNSLVATKTSNTDN